MRRIRGVLLATTALTTVLWTAPAVAADWIGAASRDWANGANWSGGTVPTLGDDTVVDTTSPNAPTVTGGFGANTAQLYIGQTGTGAVQVTNGSLFTDSHLWLGYNAGSSGTLSATGPNSSVNVSGNLHVGHEGTGVFSLSEGAGFYGIYAFVGSNSADSKGSLTLDGAGTTFTLNNDLHVGLNGTGTLSVTNGARGSTSQLLLGTNIGTVGTAMVSGAGSSWLAYSYLSIGHDGSGTLDITNGGVVSGGYTYGSFVGNEATGSGTVNVKGAGSQFSVSELSVGYRGTGVLNVTDGATAAASGFTALGYLFGSNGAATISGAGSVLNSPYVYVGHYGTGTLTLSNGGAVNTNAFYIGGDNIFAGTGDGTVNIGAASGSAPVAPGQINAAAVQFGDGTGRLVFNHTSQNYNFAPVIAGPGEVIVEAGTTILSGANTYAGFTTVNGGTLLVTGSTNPSGLIWVNQGGTLGGTGTVGHVFVADFATLAPGMTNSIGTLTIDGVLMLCGCSTYLVKADSLGNADKTVVGGPAYIAGMLRVAPTAWIGSQTTYTIMSTPGGPTGAFDSTAVTRPGWARVVDWTISGDDVLLTLDRGSLASAMPSGATINQKAVGNAIDSAIAAGATPNAQLIALMGLTGSGLLAGLDQASGQGASQVTQTAANASNLFMNAMFDPFAMGRTPGAGSGAMSFASAQDAMAYAGINRDRVAKAANDIVAPAMRDDRFDQRWGVWASGYGGSTTTDGNATAGSNDVRSSGYGIVAGADYRISPQTLIGFALGGGGSSFTLSQGLGSGSADIFNAGLFARHDTGAAYLVAGASYSYQDTATTRTVTVAGSDQLQARFNANIFAGRVEGGYRFGTAAAGFAPYGAVQVTQINLPGYSETAKSGSAGFALTYGSNDTTITRTELGARIEQSFALQAAMLTLRGRAAWAHDEGNDGAVSATFVSLPGATFTIDGSVPAKDLALVSAGAELRFANNVSLGGSFEGEFSGTTRGYGGKGRVRYVW